MVTPMKKSGARSISAGRVSAVPSMRQRELEGTLHTADIFCSRFVREVMQESTGVVVGEATTFRELLERKSGADLRLWKVWYFGRIPWERATVTPESLYASPSLKVVFDGTLHQGCYTRSMVL